MKNTPESSATSAHEETYLGYEIYVEVNRDPYRGGFEWSVCKDGVEIEVGLDFSIDAALNAARKAIDQTPNTSTKI